MPEANGELRFNTDDLFSGATGTIDHQLAVIRGVSIITGGVTAEGHNLEVDDTTLQQLQSCAKAKGKIPVTLDHGGGVKDLNGYITGFRMDGNKLRGDWHLLKSHEETIRLLERAERMPTCFGLSVAFKGPPKGVPVGGGKMAARCEKLLSIDCVTRPAANEGLFSVPEVDKSKKVMAKAKGKEIKFDYPEGEEPTLRDVMGALQTIHERQNQQDEFNQAVVDQFQGAGAPPQDNPDGPSLQDLTEMDDEQLAQLGLTRAEVDAAVQEVMAAMEGEGTGEGDGGEGGGETGTEVGQPGGAAMAGIEGMPAGAGATAMEALKKEVIQLKNKEKFREMRARRDAEDHEFAAIEEKVLVLAAQRDKAIELAEGLQAEVDALRLAVKTGTRPVKAGVDNGLRMFGANDNGELHEFQVRVKQLVETGKSEGEAVRLAQKENPAAHADWVQSQRGKAVASA